MESIDTQRAVTALAALAHDHRLAVFRLLVQAGPDGLAAGEIADRLALPASSLSFHLAHLRTAEVVLDERQGRSIRYRANYAATRWLTDYLMENCCADADAAALAEGACR
jgi:ArsR family transcriptional regulator, arsenate/arsenite/antimonite-responsive transcriptional repressor